MHLMRALLLHNYEKLSRIFSCILLISNHVIFLVKFRTNEHVQIFSKTTNCTRLTGSCSFVSLWKNYPCTRALIALEIMWLCILISYANCNSIVKSSEEEFHKTIDLEGREKARFLRLINMIDETLYDRPSWGLSSP